MSKQSKKIDVPTLLASLEGRLEVRAIAEWPIRTLAAYEATGERISITPRGNYVQSRIRPLKPSQWSVGELMDWVEGLIVPHRTTRPEELWQEIYVRWGIPNNYTTDAATILLLTHQHPECTDAGLLIEDRRRVDAPLIDLTYTELMSMYLGDIATDYNPRQLRKRIMSVARVVTDAQFQGLVDEFSQGVVNMSALSDQILGAFEARKELYRKYGKRVTDDQLAINTKAIYNNLRRVMKADYADFADTWRQILKFVDTHYTTVFHPAQIRRGWPQLDLTGGNLHVLDRLLTLMVGTRNPATRRADARFYKLDYILEYITNAKERENIIAFYTEQ